MEGWEGGLHPKALGWSVRGFLSSEWPGLPGDCWGVFWVEEGSKSCQESWQRTQCLYRAAQTLQPPKADVIPAWTDPEGAPKALSLPWAPGVGSTSLTSGPEAQAPTVSPGTGAAFLSSFAFL